MSEPFTEKQLQSYADNGGCPYCGSDNIEGNEVVIEDLSASQTVYCRDCHEVWQEMYTLTHIASGCDGRSPYQEVPHPQPRGEGDEADGG